MSKKNKRIISLVSVAVIVLAVALFVICKIRKGSVDEPQDLAGKSKMVSYKADKAYDGVNVLTTLTDDNGCLLFSNKGLEENHLPGNFCVFIPEKGIVTSFAKTVQLIDKTLGVVWKAPAANAHHDIQVNMDLKQIYFLDEKRSKDIMPGFEVSWDVIVGLDLDGKENFRWDARENFPEMLATMQPPSEMLHHQTAEQSLLYEMTHFTSIDIIPAGLKTGKAFSPGNILVTSTLHHGFFILDPHTKHIVWSYINDKDDSGVSSARMTKEGNIVFFKNHEDSGRSEIVILDPRTKEAIWSYQATTANRFYSVRHGHVQQLPNGNFLVTDNPAGGHAFEVTPDKEIVWEWATPFKDPSGKTGKEIYRVVRVPHGLVADFANSEPAKNDENKKD